MMARAYLTSYRLPVITTRGNNVYGPHQFPEKMIPKFTLLASRGQDLPVHGDGARPLPRPAIGSSIPKAQAELRASTCQWQAIYVPLRSDTTGSLQWPFCWAATLLKGVQQALGRGETHEAAKWLG